MSKIIAGRSILLNTVTNCTFVASKTDEEVQTSTRDSDKHIEWFGELNFPVYDKDFIVALLDWYSKLSPSEKISVWSKSGEHSGIFNMDSEQLLDKFVMINKMI
jgi:hypothetical protein